MERNEKGNSTVYLCCRNLRPCLHACAYKGGVSVYSFQSQLLKSAKKRRKRYYSGIVLITYLLTAISLRKVRVLESTSFLFFHNQLTAWPNDEILGTSRALCDKLRDCCAAADGRAVRTWDPMKANFNNNKKGEVAFHRVIGWCSDAVPWFYLYSFPQFLAFWVVLFSFGIKQRLP